MRVAVHTQSEPAKVWVIRHNLNRIPIVQVLDADNCVVTAAVVSLNRTYATVEFEQPTTGSVQLI